MEVRDEVHAFKINARVGRAWRGVENRVPNSMMHDFARSYSVDSEHYHLVSP